MGESQDLGFFKGPLLINKVRLCSHGTLKMKSRGGKENFERLSHSLSWFLRNSAFLELKEELTFFSELLGEFYLCNLIPLFILKAFKVDLLL